MSMTCKTCHREAGSLTNDLCYACQKAEYDAWHAPVPDDVADRAQSAEAARDQALAQVGRLREALEMIARGSAHPEPHGHYLAHREAVKAARAALADLTLTPGDEPR